MRTFAILLLGVAVATALPIENTLIDEEPVDGWFVPQVDGSVKWQSVEEFQLEMRAMMKKRKDTIVKFYLYSNSNPNTSYEIKIDDAALLSSSPFNKDLPTRIIIHGWLNDNDSDINTEIRSALLDTGNYNVISVDWRGANTIIYTYSVSKVREVGKKVAALIEFLNKSGGLSLSNLKLIGHSLGAHVSGYAGKYLSNGQIHSIIGLDPALPGFSYDDCNERLCTTDAYYVETITTDGGFLGFLKPIGKAAFYANGGKSQPGCGIDLIGTCAHSRSHIYYAEAIRKNNFLSIKCTDYKQANEKACGDTYSTTVRFGAPSNADVADGIFYTPANKEAAFGTA